MKDFSQKTNSWGNWNPCTLVTVKSIGVLAVKNSLADLLTSKHKIQCQNNY